MNRKRRVLISALAAVAIATFAGVLVHSWGQDRLAAADDGKDEPDSAAVAAVKRTAEAFAKAFNAGDAKAIAAFWTRDGEFVGAEGDTIRGRELIEKSYREYFKKHPKTAIEVEIDSVRRLGRHTTLQEGR